MCIYIYIYIYMIMHISIYDIYIHIIIHIYIYIYAPDLPAEIQSLRRDASTQILLWFDEIAKAETEAAEARGRDCATGCVNMFLFCSTIQRYVLTSSCLPDRVKPCLSWGRSPRVSPSWRMLGVSATLGI